MWCAVALREHEQECVDTRMYCRGLHKALHVLWNMLAVVCNILALVAVYMSHSLSVPKRHNLSSTHAYLGILMIVLVGTQVSWSCSSSAWSQSHHGTTLTPSPTFRSYNACAIASQIATIFDCL